MQVDGKCNGFCVVKSITVHACNMFFACHSDNKCMASPNDNSFLTVACMYKIDCSHQVTLLHYSSWELTAKGAL